MPSIRDRLKPYLQLALNPGWLCFVWFGMTAGISLLETPVKFTAPELSRVAAIDVGRVVFAALNKAELVALILVLILVKASALARSLWTLAAALALIVLAQSVWLLPALTARSQLIVSGIEPSPSPVHAVYSVLEVCKLVLLLALGLRALANWRTD